MKARVWLAIRDDSNGWRIITSPESAKAYQGAGYHVEGPYIDGDYVERLESWLSTLKAFLKGVA